MRCLLSPATIVLSLALTADLEAGARGGKIRWSSNSDIPNRRQPLKVLPRTDKGPGYVQLKIVFKARERAEFAVMGDGDTHIDLVIKDAKGRVVAEDVHPVRAGSDLCLCRWTPDEEQEYTIIIYNHGMVYNLCQAACN